MLKLALNLIKKKPILAVFDVTKRCNSKCNMCSIWHLNPDKSKELSLNQIRSIFSDLKDFGIHYVFLQGGEPLLRSDIIKIVDLMIELGLKPALITNGLLLNETFLRELSKRPCRLGVSLDTLSREKYEKIRGVDGLRVVMSNLKIASKLKHELVWDINATITNLNYNELLKLYNFANKISFHFTACPYNYSLCHVSFKSKDLVFKNLSAVRDEFIKLNNQQVKDGLFFDSLFSKEIINYLSGYYGYPCDALTRSILVNEQGFLSPCIEMSPLFDLKKHRIKEVWPKINYNSVINCYKQTPCFYGCTRLNGSLIKNWKLILKKMITNPMLILRYKNKFY